MGAGIAQVALAAGASVRLQDVSAVGLDRAQASIQAGLAKLVEKGRLSAEARDAALTRLVTSTGLDVLADATLVIEAAPEDLALKRELFARLEDLCGPETLLATNTSSIPVTQIASGAKLPGRVVGIHFFNPAPLMALVEVIRGGRTDEATMARAVAFAEACGKSPVVAADRPGFVVNRVARPFYGEALRLVGDHGAVPAAVDRALTGCLGFKMGPFALMDLIGIDVNLAVTESVWRAYYEEPRFRPHPLQRAMVDAGRLGRKTGEGFYTYPDGAPGASTPPRVPPTDQPLRLVFCGGATAIAAHATRWNAAGHHVDVLGDGPLCAQLDGVDGAFELGDAPPAVRAARRARLAERLPGGAWLASDDLECSALAIGAATGRTAWRFATWPAATEGHFAVEVALPEDAPPDFAGTVTGVLARVGAEPVFVPDLPGLVGPRTLAMLVNEAAYAVEEGVADAPGIDLAMRLGTGYPLGPLAWGDLIGPDRVVALLQILREAFGERYRPAPWLVRRAAAQLPLADMPEGTP